MNVVFAVNSWEVALLEKTLPFVDFEKVDELVFVMGMISSVNKLTYI